MSKTKANRILDLTQSMDADAMEVHVDAIDSMLDESFFNKPTEYCVLETKWGNNQTTHLLATYYRNLGYTVTVKIGQMDNQGRNWLVIE